MVSLAMILHDHGSLGKILARSCQDLGKHTHASWQACQDSCHWEGTHQTTQHDVKQEPDAGQEVESFILPESTDRLQRNGKMKRIARTRGTVKT